MGYFFSQCSVECMQTKQEKCLLSFTLIQQCNVFYQINKNANLFYHRLFSLYFALLLPSFYITMNKQEMKRKNMLKICVCLLFLFQRAFFIWKFLLIEK